MAEPDAQATRAPRTSWRKRHPLLSRALLYSLLVIAAGVVVWLWLDGRNRKLRAELRTMDVLSTPDADGQLTLKVLAESFSGPFLPADVRRDAHRVRAFAYAKGNRAEDAFAELDAALALTRDARVEAAIRMERAQLLAWTGEAEEALSRLDAAPAPASPPTLVLFWSLARAQALSALERTAEAATEIDAALEACPRPLPPGDALWIAGTPYTPSEVARLGTKALDALSNGGVPPAAWERLLALAPDSFGAAVEATRALLSQRNRQKALACWRRAIALDPAEARKMEAAEPDLRRLGDAARKP